MMAESDRKCPLCGELIDPETMEPLLKPIKDECWDCPWYKKIVVVMAPVMLIMQLREKPLELPREVTKHE